MEALHRELGEIKGLLTGISQRQSEHAADLAKVDARLNAKIEQVDDRLRHVERGAAVAGAVTGGVMAVAIGLIKSSLKIGG